MIFGFITQQIGLSFCFARLINLILFLNNTENHVQRRNVKPLFPPLPMALLRIQTQPHNPQQLKMLLKVVM